MIANAIKARIRQDDKQNYRGIEKPKIDSFDGNMSKYRQWKRAFDIMYTPDRNLPKDHLATALIGLLKGEAKMSVHSSSCYSQGNRSQLLGNVGTSGSKVRFSAHSSQMHP